MVFLLCEVSFVSRPTRLPMSQFLAFEIISRLRVVRCDKVSLHDLISDLWFVIVYLMGLHYFHPILPAVLMR